MDRVVGIETEYGCLVAGADSRGAGDGWPAKVKNHLFRKMKVGALDRHYRDYEEPPGNGGFLLNGGRIYLDMGHLEYASPECTDLRNAVIYDRAGDQLLQLALDQVGVADRVSFIKNNVDHQTGATFGCHENYLMKRSAQFTPAALGALLSFLATRQLFTGAGRVGQATPMGFEHDTGFTDTPVAFQISQRADHIVTDIYQWVQFNRSIINARDEPLADHRKFRRLHLLIGDSNMSPFATALKLGTTACILSLLERGLLPDDLALADAVQATRVISRDRTEKWLVEREDGGTMGALDVQWNFLGAAEKHLRGIDAETDWVLENWSYTLDALNGNTMALIGGVDWVTKKWLLETFMEAENVGWDEPWLESIDLEYHNIDSTKGLFFSITPAKQIGEWNASAVNPRAMTTPPANTRASGRGRAVAALQNSERAYVINWDSVATENDTFVLMSDPFRTYEIEVAEFIAAVEASGTLEA